LNQAIPHPRLFVVAKRLKTLHPPRLYRRGRELVRDWRRMKGRALFFMTPAPKVILAQWDVPDKKLYKPCNGIVNSNS
jgi:hypothetical protein